MMTEAQIDALLSSLATIAAKLELALAGPPATGVTEEERLALERAKYDADLKVIQASTAAAELQIAEANKHKRR